MQRGQFGYCNFQMNEDLYTTKILELKTLFTIHCCSFQIQKNGKIHAVRQISTPFYSFYFVNFAI